MSKEDLRARLEALRAEADPDDGVDPRWDRRQRRTHTHARATGRIARALSLALSDADDDRLRDAVIVDVHLEGAVATVVVDGGTPEAWTAAAAWLREALARTLRRRRVPELRFVGLEAR